MKVLVTGGTGMVGRAVEATAPEGVRILCAGSGDADLRDARACADLFTRFEPTHVIHLAARVGGVLENSRRIGEFFRDNILINTNVLESARDTGAKKIVSLLSSCVYPDGAKLPLREADLHAGEPHASNFGYAYAKRMLEVQSRAYRQQFGLGCVCLIPNNIYGPHDNFDLEASHVIPALVRKIHAAKTEGGRAVVWGDGAPLREFTYSHDIGRAIWWALRAYDAPEPLNIGTPEEVSIRQTAENICRSLGVPATCLDWDASRPSGQHRKSTDSERFWNLSGLPVTPLAEGIDAMVRWYVDQYPDVRGIERFAAPRRS